MPATPPPSPSSANLSGIETRPKIRTNTVTIRGASVTSVVPVQGSLVYPSGQPAEPDDIGVIEKDGEWTVTVECGRHNDSGVASDFLEACGGAAHVYAPSAATTTPDALNFYVLVEVHLTMYEDGVSDLVKVPLYLGQGNHSHRNRWWMGGGDVVPLLGGRACVAPTPDGVVEVEFEIDGGVSDFVLDGRDPDPSVQLAWLGGLPDDQTVNTINLPGTHDSASIRLTSMSPYACHRTSITSQLYSGVRLLDVRISVHEDSTSPGGYRFVTCHGHVGSNEYQSLSSLLLECKTFLAEHPSEFVAMSFQIDDYNGIPKTARADVGKALGGQISQSGVPILDEADRPAPGSLPTLGEVRGKVYVLSRIGEMPLGVDIGWGINVPSPGSNRDCAEVGPRQDRTFTVFVQDRYEDLGVDPWKEKTKLFAGAVGCFRPDSLLINFASGTTGGLGIFPDLMGVYVIDHILSWIGETSAAERSRHLGWSLFDYETNTYYTNTYGPIDVVRLLVASNFGYSGYEEPFDVLVAMPGIYPGTVWA